MSYILNALKKSEQERQRQQQEPIPAAQVFQPVVTTSAASLSMPRLFVLIFLAMCLAIGVFVLVQKQLFTEPSENPKQVSAAEFKEPKTLESVDSSRPSNQSDEVVQQQEPPVSVAKQNTPQKTNNEMGAVARSDDPASPPFDVLKSIPDLDISGHLYSSIPTKRKVTMNGREWREGQPIKQGISIEEITPDGLVLNAGGWPVVIGRSQGWKKIDDID